MTRKDISHLICRHCNSKFSLGTKSRYIFCPCSRFPILNGIIYLSKAGKENNLSRALGIGIKKSLLFYLFIKINQVKKLSFNHPLNLLLLKLLWNIDSKEFKYFLNRQTESESLLFFTPLAFKKLKPGTTWLDIGSGITNYYSNISKLSTKTRIYSVDKLFRNLYLSHFFFPQKNTTYICCDINLINNYLTPHSFDIVTQIDCLPFVDNHAKCIKNIQEIVKKDGVVFISNIVQTKYKNIFFHTNPISISRIKRLFSSPIHIFDDILLCQNLLTNETFTKSLLKTSRPSRFRYSILWPSLPLPSKFYLPNSLKNKTRTIWFGNQKNSPSNFYLFFLTGLF